MEPRLSRCEDGAAGRVPGPGHARRELREARGEDGLAWITSHTFRKTAATILDEAALSARLVADQLGHSRTSNDPGLLPGPADG